MPENTYYLPVVMHNLKNYDSHFIIKHFEKKYSEKQQKKTQKLSFDDIHIIPQNGERFLQFQIGNVKFLDWFQCLTASLDHLVGLLLKSGKENFQHATRYLDDNDLVFAKGIYLYSYMENRSKFDETKLPSIESFYNTLNDKPLSV